MRNPVLFVTAVVALLLTVLLPIGGEPIGIGFQFQLIVWLWLTVLFGTFAEALAEGRGKAQAASSAQHQGRSAGQAPDRHGRRLGDGRRGLAARRAIPCWSRPAT